MANDALRANAKLLMAQANEVMQEQYDIINKLDWEESEVKVFLEAGHTVTLKIEHSWEDHWRYFKVDDGEWFNAERKPYPEGVPEDIWELDWSYGQFTTHTVLKTSPAGDPSGTEITRFSL